MTAPAQAHRSAQDRAERRLAETYAAGYARGLADAQTQPMSPERRARLSLLISPVGPLAGRRAAS